MNDVREGAMRELVWENMTLRRALDIQETASEEFMRALYDDSMPLEYALVSEAKLKVEKFYKVLEQHMSVTEDRAPMWSDKILYQFSTHILTDLAKEVEYKWPATWWDATKERFAPDWFKKRWPVKYTGKKINAFVLYPELSVQLPRESQWVHWEVRNV